MTTLLVKPKNKKELAIIKRVLKALNTEFETNDKKKNQYNPKFVEMILEGDEAFKNGEYHSIKTEDLWK